MSDEFKNIMQEQLCLSRNEMQDYLADRLAGNRLRRVELHLVDCELCTEAIDGLRLLSETETNESLVKIDNRISRRLKENPVLIMMMKRSMAVAAVLIVVIIGAFFLNEFMNQKHQEVAQNFAEKKSDLEKSVDGIHYKKDSIYDKEKIKVTQPVGNGKPIEDVKVPGQQPVGGFVFKNLPKDENQSISNDNLVVDVSPPTVNKTAEENYEPLVGDKLDQKNDLDVSTKSITSPQTVTLTTDQLSFSPSNSFSSGSSPQLSPSLNQEEVEITSGKKNKNEKDKIPSGGYTKSRDQSISDSVSIDVPSDLFNQAMQYKSSGEKEKAIEKLDELIKLNNELKPQAMWEKAFLLINLNKKDKAKTVLADLSKIESAYKQKAIDKLKEL